ncbi:anti-phage dCTP deaminase [Chryseobacterium gambrini]|uniref:Deoxycytidylate deaminase n=1 Tax=Chryseobacterium gambrini TaxID=373672 RepID=A0A1N7MEN0_9FLAO|nr:anti-phage dCTP deaminase [Chryseobacterium gambrini]SIS84615.1 Deoxycytidylate deaminase [Chryseobacterium gambrini]
MDASKKLNNELNLSKGKTTRDKVENTQTEELFIGICAPIGSSREVVIEEIKKQLNKKYFYDVEIIKLSKFIEQHKTESVVSKNGETQAFSNLMHKITEGDKLRKRINNSVLAELAIRQILFSRLEEAGIKEEDINLNIEDLKSRRKCFIFDSIKNLEELLLLRSVYTENFYLFSIFSPLNERKTNLQAKDLSPSEIDKIVNADDFENNDFGQNVKGTFIEGDFIVRVSNENIEQLNKKIERYLHLIFESEIITPTFNETAMYSAKSASVNSACLSRQVGASITDKEGNLISTGWNDVPKFGGNLYKEEDINDKRCKVLGYCSNDNQKNDLIQGILNSIITDPNLKDLLYGNDLLVRNIIENILVKSKIKDLIEFSRSVHAEMHAIISGSQLAGSKMVEGKLFCTTYPCHNCARHIIVSGIKEIYYIEPYSKSLCITLHSDAITEDEKSDTKVRILVYDGVAPRRYLSFFNKFADRKKDGKLAEFDLKKIKPKSTKSLQALPTLEHQAIHSLEENGLN